MPLSIAEHDEKTYQLESPRVAPRGVTMRDSLMPSSRSKIFTTEPLADGPPDIPVLETADLPSEADWVLMKSLRFDDGDFRDIDPDTAQATRLTITDFD